MTSLQDYVEQQEKTSPRVRCMTCKLPAALLEQVNHARRGDEPVTYKLISGWLQDEHQIQISVPTLQNHFKFNHHQRNGAGA